LLRLVTVHFSPAVPSVDGRATSRMDRFKRDTLTLAIGCVAAVGITLVLYLAAPATLRDGVVSAFLGFDEPTNSAPAPRPMRL
jgi:hypothetical protein